MKAKLLGLLLMIISFVGVSAQINTDRVMAIGQNALYFQDYVLAIQYFNQVITVKPYLPEPYFYRAIAKIQLEDYVGAEADCTSALTLNPFMPGAYYARGFSRVKLNDLTGAEADLAKSLEYNPENPDLLRIRLWVYELEKNYDKALADIDALVKRNKKEDSQLSMDKGQVLLEKGDTLGAMQSFTTSIDADSTKNYAWSARATLKLQMHDNTGSLYDLNKAIALKSTYAGDYINRGLLNYWNKNYRGAFADYDKAIELDGQNLTAHFNRGMLRSEVGDLNNAILDFNKVIELDPENYDAYYQLALLNSETGDLNLAIKDYSKIIQRYPNFSPAYWGRSHVKQLLRDAKGAYLDQVTAQDIEKKRPETIKKETVNTSAKMAQSAKPAEAKAAIFNDLLARTGKSSDNKNEQEDVRGTIQNNNIDIANEPNFVISFYSKENQLKRLNYFYEELDLYNKKNGLSAPLKITNTDIALTSDMAQTHFATIKTLGDRIKSNPSDADNYFMRGINYVTVQDYSNALDDFTHAIDLQPDFMLAYFCRANTLYKLLDFKMNNPDANSKKDDISLGKLYKHDFDVILNDYNKAIGQAPNFAFARFNEGNLLCQEKDFQSAIDCYTEAIKAQSDFAEAYFNRGLAYLYINDTKRGIADLSKAGELGIYQAYNVMKRISEN
jgi:tetratricopeptide (TPR) repeat protein